MSDLISIIVPVYGVEMYLNQCVDSLLNQSYSNIEIILVDDQSPDNCGVICESYRKLDCRVKVIHKLNGGLSDARNVGIDNSSGSYLIFVDSDDYIEQKMVERLYNTILNDQSDMCICNRLDYYEYRKDRQFECSYQNSNSHLLLGKLDAIKELASFNLFDMSAWAKIYKKELFNDLRFPVGKFSEDYYIMYKLFDKCNNVSYINEALYIYRQRKGSISKNNNINYDYKYAAYEQMVYIGSKYPELKKYVDSAYALSNMTIYNWHIKNRNEKPSNAEYTLLRNEVRKYSKSVFNNEKLSKNRKIQVLLFLCDSNLYSLFYKMYLKI